MATQVPGYGEDAIPAPTPAPTTASDDKTSGEAVTNSQDTAASTRNDPPFASHTWSDTMGPMPRMPSLTRSDSMREHHAVRRLVKQFEVEMRDSKDRRPPTVTISHRSGEPSARLRSSSAGDVKRPKRDHAVHMVYLNEVVDEWRADTAESLLSGRARSNEIKFSQLSPQEQKMFTIAMGQEWKSWTEFEAIEVLDPVTVEILRKQGARFISTRWVLTDKNSTPRSLHPNIPLLAKARLVVIGCQEDTSAIRGDSPKCSLLAVHLICSTTASRGWQLCKLDAKNAYLQAGGITRTLLLRMPRPAPPGVSPDTIARALDSIYGTKDAGRGFWLFLKQTLEDHGFTHSKLENALFYFHNSSGQLTGMAGTHVDDVLLGFDPDCPEIVSAIEIIREKIPMTRDLPPFRYCGRDFQHKTRWHRHDRHEVDGHRSHGDQHFKS